jgi:predicted metal-dependent hydrolase
MKDNVRKLFFEDLGWIIFRRNSNARRMIIRVKNDGQVYVTIPFLASFRKTVLFVNKKKDWILKVQERLKQDIKEPEQFNEFTEFYTVNHKVIISRHSGKNIQKSINDKFLTIRIPLTSDINSHDVQAKIRSAIINTWRLEAKEILVKRTYKLASENNFPITSVKIKNMHTRWGSCSKQNIINLNLHLLRLPEYLQDYIILHELVHTIHKNHKNEFWNRLNQLTGDAKKLSKDLKKYNLTF